MSNKLFLPNNYKLAIVGSHSCGKTSLVKALSKRIEIPIINEIAATFNPASRFDISTQYNIMQAQVNAELQKKSFLSDRSVIDNLAYSTLIYKLDPLHYKSVYDECSKLSYNHLLSKPYNLLIFVDELLPLRPSAHRNFMDKKDQIFIYEFIKEEISSTDDKYFGMPIIKVRGDIVQRIKTVMRYLN